MPDNTTLNIPKDVLDPIIHAHITKAIIEALGREGKSLVEQAVSTMLTMKVNEHGQKSQYSSDKTMWIDWAIMDTVQKVAKDAITEYFNSHQSEVKKAIVKELGKTNSPLAKELATGLVTGTAKVLENSWRMHITFQLDK